MKRVAIVQSCYIPWKGYFDLINSVDEFVLYDESQYTRQDWRNRNRIKTSSGTRWLTIPVTINGLYNQRIDETRIADARWAERHWAILHQAYRRASQYDVYADEIQAAYERVASKPLLSDVNRTLLEAVCRVLDIRTTMSWSTNYRATRFAHRPRCLALRGGRRDGVRQRAEGTRIPRRGALHASRDRARILRVRADTGSTRSHIPRSTTPCRSSTCSFLRAGTRLST